MNIIDYKKRKTKIQKTQTFSVQTQKAITSLIITLSALIIGFGWAFLYLTNSNASKGYSIEQSKLENEQLKNLKEAILNKITRSTTTENIETTTEIKDMKEPEDILYVSPEDNKI